MRWRTASNADIITGRQPPDGATLRDDTAGTSRSEGRRELHACPRATLLRDPAIACGRSLSLDRQTYMHVGEAWQQRVMA